MGALYPGILSSIDPAAARIWLPAVQPVELMRRALPGLRETKFTWVLAPTESAIEGEGLSPNAAALVPIAAAAVKALL